MKPVIIVCGLLGTGKTTLSKKIDGNFEDYKRFNTDDVREELGIKSFDRKDTPMVNDCMYDQARKLLEEDKGVMFDSAYKSKIARQKIYEIAKYYNKKVLVIQCVCSDDTAKRRISERDKKDEGGLHKPTTDPNVYDEYKKIYENIELDLEKKNDFVSFVKIDTEKLEEEILILDEDCKEYFEKILDLIKHNATTS
jgi:predicted kinase